MVKLEVWEQRIPQDPQSLEADDDDVKRIPLFDRVLPKAQVTRLVKQEQSKQESESDSVDYDNFFESDFSDANQEQLPENTEYADDWRRLQAMRAADKISRATYNDFKVLPRAWDSVFYISTMHNLENVEQQFFYCIKVKHVNDEVSKSSGLGNITMYTPQFTLKPGEYTTLQTPMFIWRKRRLTLPYGQLQHYVVKIELWRTHLTRINTLYGVQQMTFQEIIEYHSNFSITLNRHIPEAATGTTAPSNNGNKESQAMWITEATERRIPVHKINVFLLLEEVFDFYFLFENWWFNMAPEMPDALRELPKALKLSVPTETGRKWDTKSTNASVNAFWVSPGVFRFRGTLRQLRYACFSARVYCVNKGRFFTKPPTLLGTCVLSLKSVQEQPLVRGIVKKLTLGTRNMFSGNIQGNIRCCMKSCTLNFFENLRIRPAQPISGSALITQLDHRCQYLVIRVIKCENLPPTNTDSNTSDPMVKVKWDGIVNYTAILESTISPVYNQNMYFPIHLVDNRELTDPALIKHSLPIDLRSKGPVVVEVWDHDDASSDFLGCVEIPLSKIYTHGVLQQRSLVDGIYTEVSQENSLGSEESAEDVKVLYTGDSASSVPYRKHLTRLFADSFTLSGATVAHRGNKSSVSLEMYIIPPMPNDLYIPEDQNKHKRTDIYRDISRRWKKEYDTWQIAYNERFPGAVTHRRFTCVTRNTTNIREDFPSDVLPLCYFIKPIQMYIQLAPPGELMHWISNFAYKEDGMSTIGHYINIDSWQMPSRFIVTRKGGLHDRALLLCCCLLGLGYDSYVCKGTVNKGKQEHCWVMTRHGDHTVTFWETANKRIWHLPHRWMTRNPSALVRESDVMKSSGNYAPITTDTQNMKLTMESGNQPGRQSKSRLMNYEIYGNEYMEDVKVDVNSILNSNDVINYDVTSLPTQSKRFGTEDGERNRKRLSCIDPKPHLLIPEKTLVCLPYTSIEVVFNDKQLWGNLQNHHPSCITYDLEKSDEWKPFLKVPLDDTIMPDVQITAPVSELVCANTAKEIRNDIIEMVELMHAQSGRVAIFTHDQQMEEHLESFIDILEFRQRLDIQFDPGMPPHLFGWSARRQREASKTPVPSSVNEGNRGDSEAHNVTEMDMQKHVVGAEAAVGPIKKGSQASKLNANGMMKGKDGIDSQDSGETTVSTDDTMVFDPKPVPIRNAMASVNGQHRTLYTVPQRRAVRRPLGLRARIKTMLMPAPRHHTMPYDDGVPSGIAQYNRGWKGKFGLHGFRLRKSRIVIRAPKFDIVKALSDASIVLGMDNGGELEDQSTNAYALESDESAITPLSDIMPGNYAGYKYHTLSYCKQRVHASSHHKEPNKEMPKQMRNAQIKVPGTGARGYALYTRKRPLVSYKGNLFKRLLRKVHIFDVPEAHAVPRFMADMQQVVQESAFMPHMLEHKYPIPYEFMVHKSQQISKWNWYYNMEARQYAWRSHLPIPPNHTFIAVPIHFSTSDMNEIRHMLTSSRRFKKLLVTDVDRCINVIYVKVFPLLGGVLSTWVFLGCHVPWNTQ